MKALVLRIDSGGGSATAAEEVGRELRRFKENTKKPIVATMGNTGASRLLIGLRSAIVIRYMPMLLP